MSANRDRTIWLHPFSRLLHQFSALATSEFGVCFSEIIRDTDDQQLAFNR